MDQFRYNKDGELFCEEVSVSAIAAKAGTPFYLYSLNSFRDHFLRFREAFSAINPTICFSIKTCNNSALISELVKLGSGIDTVSGGEIYLAVKAGADPSKIVFAGIGKTDDEIALALDYNVGIFNVESEQEFETVAQIARQKNKKIKAALRVNPDVVDARTHDKTKTGYKGSKFGVDIERAKAFFQKYGQDEYVNLCGIHIHIGSPIYSPEPYRIAITKIIELINYLKSNGHQISVIDIGGGYSADYETDASSSWPDFAGVIVPLLKPFADQGVQIILEPGRTISGNSAILVSKVTYMKKGGDKDFAIIDTGMHHIIRPALYDASHFIWPVKVSPALATVKRTINDTSLQGLLKYDVVGPICESSDYLAKDRLLPQVKRGDLLAIFTAGAYGFVMSSQYNAIPRPAEIVVDKNKVIVVREKESYDDLMVKNSRREISI